MRARLFVVLLAVLAISTPGAAQRFGRGCYLDAGGYYVPPDWAGNPLYDGRVIFARIRYRGTYECGQEGPGWAHDYPTTDVHVVKIFSALSTMRPFIQKGNIFGSTLLSFSDPALMKFPVAYLSEAGGWDLNAAELAGFKAYIARGGFLIFDDMGFRMDAMPNLMFQWRKAFPGAQVIELKQDHPIFNSFFKIDLSKVEAYYDGGRPARVWGIYEGNDPTKRLLAVINNYNDLGEYIEFSEQGFDVVPTNEAYKLMIDYFMYALSR